MASWSYRLSRLWRHRWTEGQVASAFPQYILNDLTQQVAASERLHTGQVRLCIEGGLPYGYIWDDLPARARAVTLFGKLRTWDTEYNNGVLIYLLMADHAIEIVADRALARVVPPEQWQAIVATMRDDFQHQAFAQGLARALDAVTQLMQLHFPRSADTPVDTSSGLPDAPVVQGRFFKDR